MLKKLADYAENCDIVGNSGKLWDQTADTTDVH
jgi:hypothetical protein